LGHGCAIFSGSLFLIGCLFPDLCNGLTLIDDKAKIAEEDLKQFDQDKKAENTHGEQEEIQV